MKSPFPSVVFAVLLLSGFGGALSYGQGTSSPEVAVELNEGIYQYLQGHRDRTTFKYYLEAIKHFTAVLDQDPQNATALLFRALSHGQIGLAEWGERLSDSDRANSNREALEIYDDPERRAKIEDDLQACTAALEDPAVQPFEHLLLKHEQSRLRELKYALEDIELATREQAQQAIADTESRIRDITKRERQRYALMAEDLQRLNAVLDKPQVAVRLLDVVAGSKMARIDEDRARDIKAGELTPEGVEDSVSRLRQEAARALERTTDILQELLSRGLQGEDDIRTRFFLGVIRFRQAVPRRAEGEPLQVDLQQLLEAERIMSALADNPQTPQGWQSYASLYLGLILPIQAMMETDAGARGDLLDQAERHLDRAVQLDTRVPGPGQEPESISESIPRIVSRQRREVISPARERAPMGYQNDFQLSVYVGAHRDTNVVLLGERTDLPRDISRESDFGFALGTALDYTLNLGKLDPGLDRWTLGGRVRTSQLWHADVDEFDEQTYGATMAIQYEAMRKRGDFGPILLRLQYDYSYTLLGREAFLGSNLLRPDLQVYWSDRRAETNLYFAYDLRTYHEPLFDHRFDRSGEYYALGCSQSFKLKDMTPIYEEWNLPAWGLPKDEGQRQDDPDYPKRYFTPFIGVEYAWDSTDGDEFDQNGFTLGMGFALPLPWGLQFDAAAEFEWQDYRHGSLTDFHRRPRRDLVQTYQIGLQRTFVLQQGELANRYTPTVDRTLMTVRAQARWTNDDSNVVDRFGQAVFEYDRVFYGITIAFAFN